MSGAVTDQIQGLVKENKVVVFSKSWCPYCSKAKGVLRDQGAEFHTQELDQMPNGQGEEMQSALASMTGARTVPRIFINGQCIGGADDLTVLQQSGKLQGLLATDDAGAGVPKSKEAGETAGKASGACCVLQ